MKNEQALTPLASSAGQASEDARKSGVGEKPTVWTQQMVMHLNGGAKFSELRFAIFADGKPTGIMRYTRTNGSPNYAKTVDKLECGEDVYNVLATRGVGMRAWLQNHLDAALLLVARAALAAGAGGNGERQEDSDEPKR